MGETIDKVELSRLVGKKGNALKAMRCSGALETDKRSFGLCWLPVVPLCYANDTDPDVWGGSWWLLRYLLFQGLCLS